MAGVAMGADTLDAVPLELESSTCNFSTTTLSNYTLAFVLDWNSLVKEPNYIFYVTGEYSKNSNQLSHLGLGLNSDNLSVWRAYMSEPPVALTTGLDTPVDTERTDVAFATLVYANYCKNASTNYPSFYLTLWGADGKELVSYMPKNNANISITSYRTSNDSITINTDVVEYAEVYYEQELSADSAKLVASSLASKLIPEPTTATLSLLALAGLAARRRRK